MALLCLAPPAGAYESSVPGAGLFGPDLNYNASPGQANDVKITLRNQTYTLVDTGVTTLLDADGSGGCSVLANTATCPVLVGHVAGVLADLGDLNDRIWFEIDVHDQYDTPNTLLVGGSGDDSLIGTSRFDRLIGGPGDDTLSGRGERDTADYSHVSTPVTVDLTTTDSQPTGDGNDRLYDVEGVEGGSADDVLVGNSSSNRFSGNGGNDSFYTRDDSWDEVLCGDGEDSIVSDWRDRVEWNLCEHNDNGESPVTFVGSGPDDPTTDTTPTFQFGANETPVTYECEVFNDEVTTGPFPCTSPYTVPDDEWLPDGDWAFSVTATDEFGLVEVDPPVEVFRVDTTPPDVTITGPTTTTDRAPAFTIASDEDGVAFECALDGGGLQPCDSSFRTPPLGLGAHSLEVSATDEAGLETRARHAFTIVVPAKCAGHRAERRSR